MRSMCTSSHNFMVRLTWPGSLVNMYFEVRFPLPNLTDPWPLLSNTWSHLIICDRPIELDILSSSRAAMCCWAWMSHTPVSEAFKSHCYILKSLKTSC